MSLSKSKKTQKLLKQFRRNQDIARELEKECRLNLLEKGLTILQWNISGIAYEIEILQGKIVNITEGDE